MLRTSRIFFASSVFARPLLCVGLLSLSVHNFAQAVTQDEINRANAEAQKQQNNEQQRFKEQLNKELKVKKTRSKKPAATETKENVVEPKPADNTPAITPEKPIITCRDIQQIELQGVKLLSSSKQLSITQAYVKKCLGVEDIQNLLAAITAAYMEKGYIAARAYLPPQDLTTGNLTILVIEGTVEKVNVQDGDKKSVSVAAVAPGVVGKPFNLRDIEQALDQINRLSSNNANFEIQPGSKAGDSVVVINNTPSKPYRIGLTFDNQGSESTGKNQLGVNVGFDNPFGINDSLSLTHRRAQPYDSGERGSWSNSVIYIVPYGYNSATLSFSNSAFASSFISPSSNTLHSSGESNQASLRLDRVLYRNQSTRWNLAASISSKESLNYLEDILLEVSSRRLSMIDIDSSFTTAFLGGSLTLDVGYTRGVTWFNALRDPSYLPDSSPKAQFSKWKYGYSYQYPFQIKNYNLSFTSSLTGQQTDDVLYGSEQISIGSIYSVRGFEKSAFSGDDGYYLRNELGIQLPQTVFNKNLMLKPYIALDHGYVDSESLNVPFGKQEGAAIGITANYSVLSCDLFHARSIYQTGGNPHESLTSFRLSATF